MSTEIVLHCDNACSLVRWVDLDRWSRKHSGQRLVLLTDPPYSQRVAVGQASGIDLPFALTDKMRAAVRKYAKLCSWSLVFSDFEGLGRWHRVLDRSPLKPIRTGVWVKTGYKPQLTGDRPANGAEAIGIWYNTKSPHKMAWNGGGKSAVWQHHNDKSGESLGHPTPKPVELMIDIVNAFTSPGDWVVDPFMGSGTTTVACMRTGRNFWGCEINKDYYETAQMRVEAERNGQSAKAQAAGQITITELLRSAK